MPISNNDRMNIMARIHSMGLDNAKEEYENCFRSLTLHRNSLDLKMDLGMVSSRDFELTVEFIVVYEGLRDDLSWWKRTQRRFRLTKDYT